MVTMLYKLLAKREDTLQTQANFLNSSVPVVQTSHKKGTEF